MRYLACILLLVIAFVLRAVVGIEIVPNREIDAGGAFNATGGQFIHVWCRSAAVCTADARFSVNWK